MNCIINEVIMYDNWGEAIGGRSGRLVVMENLHTGNRKNYITMMCKSSSSLTDSFCLVSCENGKTTAFPAYELGDSSNPGVYAGYKIVEVWGYAFPHEALQCTTEHRSLIWREGIRFVSNTDLGMEAKY